MKLHIFFVLFCCCVLYGRSSPSRFCQSEDVFNTAELICQDAMLLFSVSCAGEPTTGRYIAVFVLILDANYSVNVMLIPERIPLGIISKTVSKIHKNKINVFIK